MIICVFRHDFDFGNEWKIFVINLRLWQCKTPFPTPVESSLPSPECYADSEDDKCTINSETKQNISDESTSRSTPMILSNFHLKRTLQHTIPHIIDNLTHEIEGEGMRSLQCMRHHRDRRSSRQKRNNISQSQHSPHKKDL